ncbi:hypothetical protein SAMN05443377_11910 [Propionibacterium cyclohexanicum]|uniref:Uncharacterized protein n=1 Tax=Propionibacterium cyclohexanicum TaxID=64702 RepID=A0A1H9T7I8_9ACTN|nr:hypothetical protein [Propionibacterium cyclohexanicum]SER92573.1 hypothetical protein SAMN05443377_11910 [Propionibacterium cyclohexanicum]
MNDTEHTVPRGHDDEPARTRTREAEPGEASDLARHRDPSLTKQAATTTEVAAKKKARPGVEWVRPSELLVSRGGRIAGRGINFQAELARRARRLPGQTYRATRSGVQSMSERARKLPPASAFGRGAGERFSWVSRSGVGLG